MTVFWGFFLLATGWAFGHLLNRMQWELNSVSSHIIEIKNRKYKVIEITSEFSYEMFDKATKDVRKY